MAERAPDPSLARAPRLPSSVAHALLVLSSVGFLAVMVIGMEALARWIAPDYLVRARGIHVFSSAYGWIGRPGAVAPMGGGRVSLNRLGFRGRELTAPRPGGRTRVVVLGDSVAFGYGVADEQVFAAVLDARDNGIEAGNFAVQGYGPGQELLVLRRDAIRAQPDVVILTVCLRNDFADAVLPVALYNGSTPRPRFRLAGGELVLDEPSPRSLPARVVGWLSDYSQLYNRASALLSAPPQPSPESWRRRRQDALREPDYVLRLSVALVEEMDRVCRERGIRFLVASMPNGVDFAGEPALHRRFHESVSQRGVALVEFRARFSALGLGPADVTLDDTGHLNPRGHAIVAEILEQEIARARRGATRAVDP